jgi:NAD-dependent SIR2 family protein deacetylase
MNLSQYDPEELKKLIDEQTQKISCNMQEPSIQKIWENYCKLVLKSENEQQLFWVSEIPKQSIHYSTEYSNVRRLLKKHTNILIFAGAGMSADSGIPVFRTENNTSGFCNFEESRNMFDSHQPHLGYTKLLEYCKNKDYYIMTSNIDGYFARAGFAKNKIIEVHGNVYNSQCSDKCHQKVYDHNVTICPECKGQMRPNVLQFGDRLWIDRTESIDKEMTSWINNKDILIIEIGAGIHIPTIREYSEFLVEKNVSLIRVNPNHWQIPKKYIKLRKNKQLLVGRVPMTAIDFFKYFI